MLNQIRTLLKMEVKLEEMKLENGTIVTAESFEKDSEIFIVSDEEKIAMPVGEYLLEDGRLLVVESEGLIADVREVSDEVPAKEETEDLEEVVTEVPEEVVTEIEAIIEAVVEVIAPVIEEVKEEIEELKKLYSDNKKKEEMSASRKPLRHNPETKTQKQQVQFGKGKFNTTLDRVINKLNQ